MSLKIGFDVDGILADFNSSYVKRVIQVTDQDKFPDGDPNNYIKTWYYVTDQFGYTKAQDKEVWKSITSDPTFWIDVIPYPDAKETISKLADLWDDGNEIYFITNRPGIKTKLQTEQWLINLGTGILPTVIVSEEKGLNARALKLDFYIDDKNENCTDVRDHSTTNCLMLARGWNEDKPGIPRIPKVSEFFKAMGEVAEWVN